MQNKMDVTDLNYGNHLRRYFNNKYWYLYTIV